MKRKRNYCVDLKVTHISTKKDFVTIVKALEELAKVYRTRYNVEPKVNFEIVLNPDKEELFI